MNNEKYVLEEAIRELIYSDNKNSVHFEYNSTIERRIDGKREFNVKVLTYNSSKNVSFILIEKTHSNEIVALDEIYKELAKNNENLESQSFVIKWYTKRIAAERPNRSIFSGKDIFEALRKFYHGSNKESLEIYSITAEKIKSKNYEG